MESERRINWISLFIKIVIIFVFILIIIWLISKILNKNKLSETFTNNINNMEKVAVEYFKKVDLPLEKGESYKITLEEMIEKKLIVSINKDEKSNCDIKQSYSKITREKKNYVIETTLKCGDEKDTITKKFSFADCKNCNQSKEEIKKEEKDTKDSDNDIVNNKTENNSSNNTINSSETNSIYYEHVKETTTYTKWMRGSKTGNNIENKYEYYGIAEKTYYSLGIINKEDISKNTLIYTIKLNNIPNKKYYFTTIEESNYFTSSEEKEYLNQKDTMLSKENNVNIDSIDEYSLTENNFTYKLSPYYRRGNFYVDVKLNIKNTNNVNSYYDSNLKKDIYFVPLKINIKFASNEITSSKPSGNYETISYYRYVETNKEVIWSTEEYVEGYIKTGNTK